MAKLSKRDMSTYMELKKKINDDKKLGIEYIKEDYVAVKKVLNGKKSEGLKELLSNELRILRHDIEQMPNGVKLWKQMLGGKKK